jgi:hypothetical protein
MDIQKTYWNNNESSLTLSFPIAKVNKEKRTVSGFASLDNIDHHGDVVTAEASKTAFENFRGNIREMHGPSAVGKMLNFKEDSYFDPKTNKKYSGIFVEAYVSKGAQDAWEKCLDGTYTGFSIGGNIIDAKMEKSDNNEDSHRVIHKYELHELSLVDSPANPLANIFSIQKMAEGIITENVFWCDSDEVSSTSAAKSRDCVVCGTEMKNIGWVEQTDIEKFEAIEKVIDTYFKKDDAPGPDHAATTHDSDNVVNSTTAINLHPDQNKTKKVSPIDVTSAIKKNEGGNEMTEETITEVAEAAEVIPAEEVAVVEEVAVAADDSVEKAVSISEVEDSLDFEKMVNDLKTFMGESLKKNYTENNQSVQEITKIFEEKTGDITKAIADLNEKYDQINKTVTEKYESMNKTITEMYGKIDYVDNKLNGFESATAVKKSSDLEGSTGVKIQKSIWQGHFLGVNSLTK